MPGSSIWLIPPESHPLNAILTTLIQKNSEHFSSTYLFAPHITLTSDVAGLDWYPNPQKFLDSLDLPSTVEVKFSGLESQDPYFKKLFVKVAKNESIRGLAAAARRSVRGFGDEEKAKKWTEEEYYPHLSLLYHNCPTVSDEEMAKIETLVTEAGVDLRGEGELGGWTGGRIVLVCTNRPIDQWQLHTVAERTL
ncbi:2',3'-cyclic-nucleotide 3'-phosphodiesteras-like protein [Sporormia fimetaria CBS 119925]|uniref:2',3'-cyclic-nucleotide 3'-phosphodiesteras-like protein n=1 Tax=Sporormia fimetaria CBS 119925 TaxID=1340428 RepID=A0A6A6VDW8_9PLEO|nr:2',3'-cyclic-nucleotide 3'-phosphodiesteras-like protein [Sporormia fimetaria CBS 119925]